MWLKQDLLKERQQLKANEIQIENYNCLATALQLSFIVAVPSNAADGLPSLLQYFLIPSAGALPFVAVVTATPSSTASSSSSSSSECLPSY